MSANKIILCYITMISCIIVGGIILKVFVPDSLTVMINAVENQLQYATGTPCDFNGDHSSLSKPKTKVRATVDTTPEPKVIIQEKIVEKPVVVEKVVKVPASNTPVVQESFGRSVLSNIVAGIITTVLTGGVITVLRKKYKAKKAKVF